MTAELENTATHGGIKAQVYTEPFMSQTASSSTIETFESPNLLFSQVHVAEKKLKDDTAAGWI